MRYIPDSTPPVLELSRRNLNSLLTKLRDPNSHKTLISPPAVNGETIMVEAVEDIEHYSDREPGEIWKNGGDSIGRLIEELKDEQAKVCVYGTREGDGKTCDCKYVLNWPFETDWVLRGEKTGCCELRYAIRVLVELSNG